jgi:hypothetical protein
MLTYRDEDLIDFLESFKIARSSTLIKLFYPSLRVGQRRLQVLTKDGYIKRCRNINTEEYRYYLKKPKQEVHSCLVSDFYLYLKERFEVSQFKIEPQYANIRPDAAFIYGQNGKNYIGVLEVEISKKGFDIEKYRQWKSSGDYTLKFPTFPEVWKITPTHNPEQQKQKTKQKKEEQITGYREIYYIDKIAVE